MVHAHAQMVGLAAIVQHGPVLMACSGRRAHLCASAMQRTQTCVTPGQANVIVNQDGMEVFVRDLAHFTRMARAATRPATARMMRSVPL